MEPITATLHFEEEWLEIEKLLATFPLVSNRRAEVDGTGVSAGVALPAGQSVATLHSVLQSHREQLTILVQRLRNVGAIPEDFPFSVLQILKDAVATGRRGRQLHAPRLQE